MSGYYVAERADLNNFYKLAVDVSVNRCPDPSKSLCYGTNQLAKIRELFGQFRQKHVHFEYCAQEKGYDHGQYFILNCHSKDGSKGNLRSSATRNGGTLAMSIEENENLVFEGLFCTSNDATQEMFCQGTGELSHYSLTVTDSSCTETLGSVGAAGYRKESCDQQLNLFEPFLKSTPQIPKKVAPTPDPSSSQSGSGGSPTPPSTIGWKNVVGAVSALGFTYLAYKEARAWQKETGEVRSKGKEQHQKASGWRALGYAGLAAGSTAFALLS